MIQKTNFGRYHYNTNLFGPNLSASQIHKHPKRIICLCTVYYQIYSFGFLDPHIPSLALTKTRWETRSLIYGEPTSPCGHLGVGRITEKVIPKVETTQSDGKRVQVKK